MLYKQIWLTRPMVAEICSIVCFDRRTVERWIQKRRIPDTPYQLLDIALNGRIELIHTDWQGWSICSRTGRLRTPNGDTVSQGDIQAIPYRKHLLAHLQTKLRVLCETVAIENSQLEKPHDAIPRKVF